MIDLSKTFVAPEGFYNPTIPKGIIKIPIINLTPGGKVEIPVKIYISPEYIYKKIGIIFNEYIYLLLFFNQLCHVI